MRYYNGNPAATTAAELGGLMSVVAVGAMTAMDGMRQSNAARREASIAHSYADALQEAQAYAWEVNAIAEAAIARVHALEAEDADLRAACRQRQGVIDRMRAA